MLLGPKKTLCVVLPLELYHRLKDLSRQNSRLGLEEAARILRYDCYKKAAESVKKEFPEKKIKLALAHHAEDNAETVLA